MEVEFCEDVIVSHLLKKISVSAVRGKLHVNKYTLYEQSSIHCMSSLCMSPDRKY